MRKPRVILRYVLAMLFSLAVCSRAQARFSSGGGSSSSHSSSPSHSFGSHSSFSSSSHSYSSGSSSSGSHTGFSSLHSSTFGHAPARAASEEESHQTFSHSSTPSGSYTGYSSGRSSYAPRASSYSYEDARDLQIRSLRSQLSWERYQNRQSRLDSFFGGYYGRSYITYNDGYSPWFWMWLMDQNTYSQANWLYNHQATIDATRYQTLLNQNQTLQSEITQLQQQRTTPDPTYTPPGLPSADLMYSNDYVQNVMDTSGSGSAPSPAYDPPPNSGPSMSFLTPILIFAGCCVLYWLFFVHRWSTL